MLNKNEFKIIKSWNEIPDGYFVANQSIQKIKFIGLLFDSIKFDSVLIKSSSFEDCRFVNSFFSDVDMQRVNFINCFFDSCVLSMDSRDTNIPLRYITGIFENTSFKQTDFTKSFLQNIKFIDCEFDDVDFKKIKAKSIDFSSSKFLKISFELSYITRGNFSGVTGLKRSLFYSTILDDCDFDWNEAFVIMEFNNPNNDNLYEYGIIEVLQSRNIEPKRVDRYEFKGRITEEILINITTSKVIIAECSSPNKNVFFEVGYALGKNKNIIFLVDDVKNIPFDLKDYKFIIHNNSINTLKKSLENRLDFLMNSSKE